MEPFIAIAFVMLLLGGTLYVLRRRGVASFNMPRINMPRLGAQETRQLRVVERLALGPQHALHLVRAGEISMLIATTPTSCQVIEMPKEIRPH